MKRRLALVLCALLASAAATAADDAAKDSMAMHKKMIQDCVAKRDRTTDERAATKACTEMLEKRMPRTGMPPEGSGKEMHHK